MSLDPRLPDRLVNFIVGGVFHSIFLSDIARYKACYFATAMKDEWSSGLEIPIVINRDGAVFQHIVSYMFLGSLQLPNRLGFDCLSRLVSIRAEADYYNLPDLVKSCERLIEQELPRWCTKVPSYNWLEHYVCELQGTAATDLSSVYLRNFFPNVLTGDLNDKNITGPLFKSSNIGTINIKELMDASELDKVDRAVRILDGHFLDRSRAVESIKDELPVLPTIKCCKYTSSLVIISKRDKTEIPATGPRDVTELGSIFYILQAATSGGAMSVTQNGVTQTISQPGEYLVCGCDAPRVVHTVESGELVYLRFKMAAPCNECHMERIYTGPACPEEVSPEVERELISAAHNELKKKHCTNVVLCLSQLYPPTSFDPAKLQMDTESEALQGRDALLFAALEPHFEVTLVTVYVRRHKTEIEGCVIGPVPGGTAKAKIIAAPYGFGKVRKEGGKFVSLTTGLKFSAKL